jgi:hypothetical protein
VECGQFETCAANDVELLCRNEGDCVCNRMLGFQATESDSGSSFKRSWNCEVQSESGDSKS